MGGRRLREYHWGVFFESVDSCIQFCCLCYVVETFLCYIHFTLPQHVSLLRRLSRSDIQMKNTRSSYDLTRLR